MSDKSENMKRTYEAPVLRIIELATDEVMGTGCKTNTGPGPETVPCTGGCSEAGS